MTSGHRTQFSRNLPVWYQLAGLLRAEITGGERPGGAQVEPELQLAAKYGVSVMPVRQALRTLEAEGLITRQRGRGTFVNAGRALGGFTSMASLYSAEFQKTANIVDRGRSPPPPLLRDAFADQAEVCFVRRLAFRDDAPWSFGTLYFPVAHEDQVTTARLQRYPLYRILADHCGIIISRSSFSVRASGANPDLAARLGVEPLSPVLTMTSISYDHAGTTVGAFDMSFASENHAFSFEVLHGNEG